MLPHLLPFDSMQFISSSCELVGQVAENSMVRVEALELELVRGTLDELVVVDVV